MNRILSIFALTACGGALASTPAGAQTSAAAAASPPTWTLFGGATLSTVEGPNDQNKEPLMGLAFGIALDWKINSTFMFQPELQYAEKGYQYNQGVPVRLKLTYVEIPLLLRASTAPLEEWNAPLWPARSIARHAAVVRLQSRQRELQVQRPRPEYVDDGFRDGRRPWPRLQDAFVEMDGVSSLQPWYVGPGPDRSIVQDTGAQPIDGISAVTAPILIHGTCKMEILTPYCIALWSY